MYINLCYVAVLHPDLLPLFQLDGDRSDVYRLGQIRLVFNNQIVTSIATLLM